MITDLRRRDVNADLAKLVLLLEINMVAEAVKRLFFHDGTHSASEQFAACCRVDMAEAFAQLSGRCENQLQKRGRKVLAERKGGPTWFSEEILKQTLARKLLFLMFLETGRCRNLFAVPRARLGHGSDCWKHQQRNQPFMGAFHSP